MLKARTKIEAVLVCLLLFSIIFSSVLNGTRTITNTGDNVDTFIKNSNGGYWTVSQANLQLAVYNCNSTLGGWVQLPQDHGLNLALINNPYNVALINFTGYNSTRWDGSFNLVNSNKNKWNATSTLLGSKSAGWNSTQAVVNAKSNTWNATSTLVSSKSPGWNASNATFIRNSNGKYWTATGANIQLAINDLTTGGTVWLPAGTIPFSTKIVMNNHTHLQGAGKYQTILRVTGATAQTGVWCAKSHDFVISDLTVHGNSTMCGGAQTAGSSNNIYIYGCENVSVYNVNSIYPSASPFSVGPGTYGYGVKKFSFYNIDTYGAMSSHTAINVEGGKNGTIGNCRFKYAELGLDIAQCFNVSIDDIIMENTTDGMKIIQGSNNINVNNIIMNTSGYGICLATGSNSNVTVSNAIVKYEGTAGFWVVSGNSYVTLTNFLLKNINGGSGDGIQIASSHNISISNGQVDDENINGNRGIRLESTKDVLISNVNVYKGRYSDLNMYRANRTIITNCNFLTPYASNCVVISGCSNWTISNCQISCFVSGYGAINLTGALCKDFIINGNRIYGHQYGVSVPSSVTLHTDFIITNNIIHHGSGHYSVVALTGSVNATANNLPVDVYHT